jgi:arylformamidase
VPLHTAVGGLESDEFRRQSRIIRAAWPHCAGHHVDLPEHNHLTVVDELARPHSPLHRAALRMMRVQ